jgi:hypothetical protein
MARIHAIQTVFDVTAGNPTSVGCQLRVAADQIVCLTQADPCSVGYESDGGKTWSSRLNVGNINGDGGASCTALVTAGLCASNGSGGFTGARNCPAACLNAGAARRRSWRTRCESTKSIPRRRRFWLSARRRPSTSTRESST